MEKRVTVRLNQADFLKLEAAAENAGATLAETLREVWRKEQETANLEARLSQLEERTAKRIKALEQQSASLRERLEEFIEKNSTAQKFILKKLGDLLAVGETQQKKGA